MLFEPLGSHVVLCSQCTNGCRGRDDKIILVTSNFFAGNDSVATTVERFPRVW
jgi:hypothetical protein